MTSIDDTNKPKKGRPVVDTEPVNLRLPREMLSAIDNFRKAENDLPTRPEGIRRLLAEALKEKGYLPK